MLRLAPSRTPLWRTPSSLQLGDEDGHRLRGLDPWQERLLDELVTGIADARLIPLARELGASGEDAERFVQTIADALAGDATPAPALRVQLPADIGPADEAALLAGLCAAGVDVVDVARWKLPDHGAPILLVSSRLVDPHRAARLVAGDVTHLPVELSGDRVVVGPLVRPGRTACIACVHAARRDLDPDWPLLAAQLLARRTPATEPVLLVEAAALAARMLRAEEEDGRSVVLSDADAERVWRAHPPHEACLCRSPAGNASADARGGRTSAPTTARAFARPA